MFDFANHTSYCEDIEEFFKLMDDISIVEEAVTEQTFLNKQVLTADPNFKLPEMPKIPKPPVPKIAKLKLDQSIKIPKKPSITDLTDKI